MKKTALALLIASLSACLTSCSSSGSGASQMPGGIIGGVTGGLIGKLFDSNNNNNNSSSNGSSGTTVNVGSSGSNTGTTTNGSSGFFDTNKGLITGAVAGYAGGAITDQFRQGEILKKYDEGYSKGKSDSIKELFFLKRDAQRPKEGENDVHYRYYEVDVPAHTTSDGVLIERHRQVIEVLE